MMAAPVFLADTSTMVLRNRDPQVRRRYERLLLEGRLALCQMTVLEVMNSAADKRGYDSLRSSLDVHRWLDVGAAEMDRAMEVHASLAARGQHRHFSLPDLIIAATAERNGATVLHYDSDYDRIAEITGQPTEWVAPQGSL